MKGKHALLGGHIVHYMKCLHCSTFSFHVNRLMCILLSILIPHVGEDKIFIHKNILDQIDKSGPH